MNVIELTQHNGKKVGVPSIAAVLIFSMEKTPDPTMPEAKTMIRYSIDGQVARHAFVKDTYKQCLSSFPLGYGGQAWAHITDVVGNDQVILNKSAAAYEELDDENTFRVIFAIPTGPIELSLKATYEEVRDMLRPEPPVIQVPPAQEVGASGKKVKRPKKPKTEPRPAAH